MVPINDGIDKEESRVQYTSFDKAKLAAGTGALMAKVDIESAFPFRVFSSQVLHLTDIYLDTCLPMGCFLAIISKFLSA